MTSRYSNRARVHDRLNTANPLVILLWILCPLIHLQCQGVAETGDKHSEQIAIPDISRIAFGSCNRHNMPQVLWDEIADQSPDVWIWLGDNIYADTEDMALMQEKYDLQKAVPGYAAFVKQVPVIGIWDDHDYGVNDGGREYPKKAESRNRMFEFLGVPASHPAWQREGAYQSYLFGQDNRRVKVILLDCRYFRDPIEKKQGVYQPNTSGTILGDAQWQWLEKALDDPEVDLFIIGSGIQIIPEEHRFEKWANFPLERERLFQLIRDKRASHVILISGDRHIGEISRFESGGGANPVYEVTSSGLTHAYTGNTSEANKWRIGPIVNALNYGLITIDWKQGTATLALHGPGKKRYTYRTINLEDPE